MIWLGIIIGFAIGFIVAAHLEHGASLKLVKERNKWKEMTRRHEQLHASAQITLAKFKALACGHEPSDPYTTLTPEREIQLYRARIEEIHMRQATAEEHD